VPSLIGVRGDGSSADEVSKRDSRLVMLVLAKVRRTNSRGITLLAWKTELVGDEDAEPTPACKDASVCLRTGSPGTSEAVIALAWSMLLIVRPTRVSVGVPAAMVDAADDTRPEINSVKAADDWPGVGTGAAPDS
jgi:hypothetical protein